MHTMSARTDSVAVPVPAAEGIGASGGDTQQIAVEWNSIADAEDPNSIQNHQGHSRRSYYSWSSVTRMDTLQKKTLCTVKRTKAGFVAPDVAGNSAAPIQWTNRHPQCYQALQKWVSVLPSSGIHPDWKRRVLAHC